MELLSTMPMCCPRKRSRADGPSCARSCRSTTMRPLLGSSSPGQSRCSRVVLPQPEGPTAPRHCFWRQRKPPTAEHPQRRDNQTGALRCESSRSVSHTLSAARTASVQRAHWRCSTVNPGVRQAPQNHRDTLHVVDPLASRTLEMVMMRFDRGLVPGLSPGRDHLHRALCHEQFEIAHRSLPGRRLGRLRAPCRGTSCGNSGRLEA